MAGRTPTKPKKAKGSNIGGGIAIAGNRLYATTGRAETLALDLASGRILWRVDIPAPARSAPTVVNGSLYVNTMDERLIGIAADDGHYLWSYQATEANTGTLGQAAPAYADGVLVAGFESGDLAAVRADSGTLVWTDNMGGVKGTAALAEFTSVRGAPVIDSGLVIAIGLGRFDGGTRFALRPARVGTRRGRRQHAMGRRRLRLCRQHRAKTRSHLQNRRHRALGDRPAAL